MLSVETVIVATAVLATIYLSGLFAVLHQLAQANDPRRVPLRARYRRGRHHIHPPWWARLGAALADGWQEAAIAYALLRGVTL